MSTSAPSKLLLKIRELEFQPNKNVADLAEMQKKYRQKLIDMLSCSDEPEEDDNYGEYDH